MHQGNRYFEHCYGADFDRRVTPAQREACWTAWLAHYTRHQPAHRIDYAMQRVEALQAGEPALSLPGLPQPGTSTGAPQAAQAAQPAPGLGIATMEANAPSIPNGCLEACNAYEGHCLRACDTSSVRCRQGCTRERAICLGSCY